jgi:hypothetical protein
VGGKGRKRTRATRKAITRMFLYNDISCCLNSWGLKIKEAQRGT